LPEKMNVKTLRTGFLAAIAISASGLFPAKGELPMLQERNWVGNFVGFENKNFQFSVATEGKAKIEVTGKKGATIGSKLAVPIDFVVQETMPDGKFVTKAIKPETLESAQGATLKPSNIVIRGKTTGDAAFECYLTEDRGVFSLGGKLLDSGTLTKNPLRFAIRVSFPDAYYSEKESPKEKVDERKAAEAFEQKISKDRVQLKWTDGKSSRPSVADPVDAGSKEISGPGIAALGVEFSSYQEKKFLLLASENSLMTLRNSDTKPLHAGFYVYWVADPAKDPEGKARLTIEVK